MKKEWAFDSDQPKYGAEMIPGNSYQSTMSGGDTCDVDRTPQQASHPSSLILHPSSFLLLSSFIVLLTLTLSSCGLFDTRAPENPVNAGSTFETPTTPTVVLRNMESALGSANASDYRKCFSDTSQGLPSFVFIPSTQGLSAAPTKFTFWGIVEEEQYIRNIFAALQQGGVCSVSFNPADVTEVPIADSVQFTASYTVNFPHTVSGAERTAEGLLSFTFKLSRQNEWYITTWRDIAVDNKSSWSLIKARFVDR
jgi:hypothetical protein